MSIVHDPRSEERQRWRNKADHLLALLRERPRTTRELIEIHGHRFSASKRLLVERGFTIHRRQMDDGDTEWAIGSYVPRIEVTEDMKAAYYSSSHWHDMRRKRLEFDRRQCVLCRVAFDLQVHHWRYDLFSEQLCDLATLCDACHEAIHANENISIHFPHFVSIDVAERLRSGGG